MRNLFLSISATQTGTAPSSLQDYMELQQGWREQPDVSQLKVSAAKLEVSQEWPPCVVLHICLKIFLETVGARVTARFVNVAAVSKTATASVTPTAVRINVLERVVFRTGTNIMDMDVTPIDTTKNYYFCLNSKKYIYLSVLPSSHTPIWFWLWHEHVSLLSNYHPEVRRRISGSSSGGQGCVTVLLRCRWDQRVSRWPRCHDKYVCYQSQDIGGERIIR